MPQELKWTIHVGVGRPAAARCSAERACHREERRRGATEEIHASWGSPEPESLPV